VFHLRSPAATFRSAVEPPRIFPRLFEPGMHWGPRLCPGAEYAAPQLGAIFSCSAARLLHFLARRARSLLPTGEKMPEGQMRGRARRCVVRACRLNPPPATRHPPRVRSSRGPHAASLSIRTSGGHPTISTVPTRTLLGSESRPIRDCRSTWALRSRLQRRRRAWSGNRCPAIMRGVRASGNQCQDRSVHAGFPSCRRRGPKK
jgi:hypothetical protein